MITRLRLTRLPRTPTPGVYKAVGVSLVAFVLLALLGTLLPHHKSARPATATTKAAHSAKRATAHSPAAESAESVAEQVGTDVVIGTRPPRADVTSELWSGLTGREPANPLRLGRGTATVTEMGHEGPETLYLVRVTAGTTPAVAVDVVVGDEGRHPVVEALPGVTS